MFELDSRLAGDTLPVGSFDLSLLLLHRDANYPWFILVPERPGITEIYQLAEEEQMQLTRESSLLARTLVRVFAADKINIAALGNVVPQLHIHHIVRYRNDPSWPGPVWGAAAATAYHDNELEHRAKQLADALGALAFRTAG